MATTSTSTTPILLSHLLDDAFLLAYAIPLLLLSTAAAFLGAFLTLDRTRSFVSVDAPPPSYDQARHKHAHGLSWAWRFEGGLGGLIGGWLCGMHLTTYLALLIVNRNANMSLSPVQFLVIWLLGSIPLCLLGGLWRIAASVFYAMIAGASFTSLVDIIFLPKSILPRLIIYTIVTPALLVLALLPNPSLRHSALRACTSLAGALGMVIAIALFTNVAPWSNPLLTLAIAPIVGPVDSREKGLSAALCVLAIAGAGCDWLLRRHFGENPDKAWDAYLAKYTKQLPLDGSRAGSFEPYQSFWHKLLSGGLFKGKNARRSAVGGGADDMIFPPDTQLLPTAATPTEKKGGGGGGGGFAPATPPPSFKPYPSTRSRKRSILTKRSPLMDSSSDTSSDEDEVKTPGATSATTTSPPRFKPWLAKKHAQRTATGTSSAPTLVNDLAPPPKLLGTPTIAEEYSDVEQDVTTANKLSEERDKERQSPGWKPDFLRKAASEERKLPTEFPSPLAPPPRITDSPVRRETGGLALPASIPPTPSLIRAIDRISRAHQEAASSSSPPTPALVPSTKSPQTPLDESFWDHVRAKAAAPTRS